MDEDLHRIEARLSAVLTLMLEWHIRDAHLRDRREPRSLERILRDAGPGTSEIASLLGKSGRVVRKHWRRGDVAERKTSGGDDEVARLLALLVRLKIGNQAEAIVELNKVGFGPSRIANLLGTSAGTVNVAISRAKNRPKRTHSDG